MFVFTDHDNNIRFVNELLMKNINIYYVNIVHMLLPMQLKLSKVVSEYLRECNSLFVYVL